MKFPLALVALGLAVIIGKYEFRYGITVALVLFGGYMLSDTVREGFDYAGQSLKYMFGRVRGLGLSQFSEDELTETEKKNSIQKFRGTYVGGLWNEGNTCFINSVVQSLASCDSMVEFTSKGVAQSTQAPFSSDLHHIIHDVNRIKKDHHNYSTARLLASVGGQKRWNSLNQEDAQEFFQGLLLALEKDYKALAAPAAGSETSAEPASGATPAAGTLKRLTPFDGEHAVRVGCLKCSDMEGIRLGILSSVDLGLDSVHTSFTLQGLLKDYCHMETIPGVECYRCTLNDWKAKLENQIEKMPKMAALFKERISEIDSVLKDKAINEKRYAALKTDQQKSLGDKTKQTMFARPMADVLMIHINRTVFDMYSGFTRKNYAPVEFPVRLNMSQFIVDPQLDINQDPAHEMRGTEEPEWYALKAAVVHYGSANFGHYICFRKFNDFWWRISDDTVDLTTEAQVLASQGVFMLFYEREAVITKREPDLPPMSGVSTPAPASPTDETTDASADDLKITSLGEDQGRSDSPGVGQSHI